MAQTGPDAIARRRGQVAERMLALTRAAAERRLDDPRAAMAEVDELTAEFAGDAQIRALAQSTQVALRLAGDAGLTDAATLRTAVADLRRLAGDNPDAAGTLTMMHRLVDALEMHQNGGTEDAVALFSELIEAGAAMPDNSLLREAAAESAPMLDLMRSLMNGVPHADLAEHAGRTGTVRSRADRPGLSDAERALHLIAAGGAALRMGEEQDLSRIDAAIADLRTAVTLTADGHPEHVFALASLALAVHRRAEVTGQVADLDGAIHHLELAREAARGPSHPHWSFVNDMLAQLRHRRGDHRPSRLAALEGLRGYAWRVLLQPDPASARAVAREAAAEAMQVAARCLADNEPADAVRAVDAGRGLMLFAATELRDPGTRLIEAGKHELAENWRAAEQPSPRLRQDVIEALADGTGLLDPPDLAEIQNALRTLGIDALVYLVPAGPDSIGWAVIAPVAGPARYLALPHLRVEADADIEHYLSALATRGFRDLGGAADDEFAASLDALCEWAWKVAMGPVVQPYLTGGDRVPRLVLIPMGDLARVPWQAARDRDGTRLVQRAAVSQAASARMLCEVAAATPVPLASTGLILADPDTGDRAADLRSARLEAYAIHRTFYPGATYVGRRPDDSVGGSGAGTPDEVRRWLRSDAATAGTMMHLASHGVIETALAAASSRLVLHGGDLTAEELIGLMTGSDRRPIGLVVLAACHTGQSIHGYDEAYSLGTMFLAAGARSVLSTQWSVPDRETSLLMYMFHHFLATERRPPWDALRRAQLWMLDDGREPPSTMPAPLRRLLAHSDPARVTAWAGFVHWGH